MLTPPLFSSFAAKVRQCKGSLRVEGTTEKLRSSSASHTLSSLVNHTNTGKHTIGQLGLCSGKDIAEFWSLFLSLVALTSTLSTHRGESISVSSREIHLGSLLKGLNPSIESTLFGKFLLEPRSAIETRVTTAATARKQTGIESQPPPLARGWRPARLLDSQRARCPLQDMIH